MPGFYADFGVADHLEGRFDLLVLHLHLVIRRLSASEDPAAQRLAQRLFDTFFHDMDRTLRAMGVGDMSVGKKVKDMIRAYYGRCAAYEEALTGEGDLTGAISRNVYQGAADASQAPALSAPALAAYVERARERIEAMQIEDLMRGTVSFPALTPSTSESGR